MDFKLVSKFQPAGDQPRAIQELATNINKGEKHQVLLGVTGSGKTYTIANVIKEIGRPTLVLSHNKTLAAQLYGEFRQLFPENAVEFFISYYDYYQPEAYIPGHDIYIEKESDINAEIEKLRLRATMSLIERQDVIIVASVSCIYGLGIPEEYREASIPFKVGDILNRQDFLKQLVDNQYARNDVAFERGAFRVKGDVVEVYPAYLDNSIRIDFFGDEIEKISRINPINNHLLEEVDSYAIYPANHFIMSKDRLEGAIAAIETEMKEQVRYFNLENKLIEAQRIEQRVRFDMEMLRELGYCSGIENYSRHFTNAKPGDPPYCLFDYFPDDYLVVIDESHVSMGQLRAMYAGDYSRKKNLIEYGFRLPSAFDNRPLKFEEFEKKINQVVYMSATPGDYELNKTGGVITELVIRPTGLIDPEIEIKPVATQVDDLLEQIRQRVAVSERILVTTLTKKMSEDLTEYLANAGVKVRYLHSEVKTMERSKIIRDLRLGEFDVLVGVNLLREGLDMPEVSLVAILDADKAGFLRSARSLIQTSGRAARNVGGKVIFYADTITDAIRHTVDVTKQRRAKQLAYNTEYNITPQTVNKSVKEIMQSTNIADGYVDLNAKRANLQKELDEHMNLDNPLEAITKLKKEMRKAAVKLEFELAAELRDRISELEELI